jgi:hypothetical protein
MLGTATPYLLDNLHAQLIQPLDGLPDGTSLHMLSVKATRLLLLSHG